ncbi:schwannomin-interacting protein 1-like isoform X2 [Panonychus citri]|nr:schwannomin-interacting protein 1-like isoform X2 [Panonychus citri]XP_053202658.1 schwannomin-interacting protein 1-like isoform X2 [Panonychus citri]
MTSNLAVRSISMQDREEIRRRLAMENDDETINKSSWKSSVGHKKGYLNKLITNTSDLRMCFFNKTPDHFEEKRDLQRIRQDAFDRISQSFNKQSNHLDNNSDQCNGDSTENRLSNEIEGLKINREKPRDLMVNLRRNKMERFRYILNTARPNDMSNFHRYHNLIIAEAKFALSQAKEMAQMQMETERTKFKPNRISKLIQLPVDRVFSREILKEMSIAKLQIIVNDLHSRIEVLNEELVQMLQDRDELHMEQDSILVDIEDATIFLLKRMKYSNSRSSGLIRKSSN